MLAGAASAGPVAEGAPTAARPAPTTRRDRSLGRASQRPCRCAANQFTAHDRPVFLM